MTSPVIMAAGFLILTAPDGHTVYISPESISAMHSKDDDKKNGGNYAPKSQCLINTSDGKFITVIEECDQIAEMLKKSSGPD